MLVSSSLFLMFFSCTQMEDPGNPFAPVAMDTQQNYTPSQDVQDTAVEKEDAPEAAEQVPAKEEKKEAEVDEDFVKKEEIIVSSSIDAEDSQKESPETVKEEPSKEAVQNTEEEKETTEASTIVKAEPETIGATSLQKEWPMRLVKTEMQLNPPRAILGLPNGKEIVIRSGSFIEEYKLVVMGIGTRSVSLAKVLPQGDHASIETIQLFSLND